MKKNILLVSHSVEITDGIKKMVEEMQQAATVQIFSLGGTADGALGTDPMKILETIQVADEAESLIFADIGSAVLSVELAYDMLDEQQQAHCHLIDAPLVEGAFAAAITAGVTDDLTQIINEAKQAAKKGW